MDPFGYYSCQFAERIQQIDPKNNTIVNINQAKIKHASILYFSRYSRSLKKFLNSFDSVERIYFHYYNPIFQEINHSFKKRKPSIISVWCFWGGDLYSLPELVETGYLGFSKENAFKTKILRKNIFRNFARNIYYRLTARIVYDPKSYIDSIKQIDYLGAYFKEDYDAVVAYTGQNNLRFVKFPYLSLELILGDLNEWQIDKVGEKIMIGHSADPGLNHYEIIQKLNGFGCTKTLLLPLNYGDNYYKEKLLNATVKFDLKLEVIDEYLPLSEYNKKLIEVGYAIFNVDHQQAFGNIITLVWLGVKVFLHKNSGIYLEFKRLGFYIFCIEDIVDMSVFKPLSSAECDTNRSVLNTILSSDITNSMNKNLLELKAI